MAREGWAPVTSTWSKNSNVACEVAKVLILVVSGRKECVFHFSFLLIYTSLIFVLAEPTYYFCNKNVF